MGSKTVPILLVTANVGSIFEDPHQMLQTWTEEFLTTIRRLDPKFIALHCQEVGGKNYEKSMKHVENFINLLMNSNELRLFDKVRVYLDEDYSSAENFTALGNLYFIHESIDNVLLWNFKDLKFIPVLEKEIHSGNIEAVATKEKAKFPQEFFPECKWSRKGFLRTRWSINGTIFDAVNIHLFHDASNFLAMESFPSVYCRNRQRALEYTLHRFHNDPYGTAPYFMFGDFNFRTDTDGVIKKLTEGLTTTQVQNNKNGDFSKLQYTNEQSELILTIGKKEFNHLDHQTVFLNGSGSWLREFDKELQFFEKYIHEFDVTFPPSYPFQEKVTEGAQYMLTRCPSWCDRVLLSHAAKSLVSNDHATEYGIIGNEVCMGDHKPVYLHFNLIEDAGIIKCCSHASYECLPVLCQCCQLYASVTINVVDMSDYLVNTRKSFDNITVDSNFLHEPITKDMLMHEPYTPESIESHSPSIEKGEQIENELKKNISVSPLELKTKLEDILRVENTRSHKFLMKRSTSQQLTNQCTIKPFLRDRSMSEVPRKVRTATNTSLVNPLDSRHTSSNNDWFEFEELMESKKSTGVQNTHNSVEKILIDVEEKCITNDITKDIKGKINTNKRMKKELLCCCVL